MANLIGTDQSIQECRASGYVVMDPTGLMKHGKLDKDRSVHITVSNPEMWPTGYNKPGVHSSELYAYDTWMSFNDLIDAIGDDKNRESIASFADWKNCQPEMDNPTKYDMLHLASDICAYQGLD